MSVGQLLRDVFRRNDHTRGAAQRLFVEPLESRVLLATLQLNPVDDNTLYEENGNNSNGLGEYFFVGNAGGSESRRALLRFDVDNYLPAGTIITGAELRLSMTDTPAGAENLSLHRLTSDWGEGTSDAPGTEEAGVAATIDDATWTNNFFGTSTWVSVGGDYAVSSSATTSVDAAGTYPWSTGNMLADLQQWVNDPTSNFGWIVIGNETSSSTLKRFNSKDHADANTHPVLEITYELPNFVDFGDAPDTAAGTSTGNYQTLITDVGPSHVIVPNLKLGNLIDNETNGQPTAAADGDDTNGLSPDDDDGLTNPGVDLALVELQAPAINVAVTNNTGSGATLYGWIDYNGNGIFELSERGSLVVPNGTIGQSMVLDMPTVPIGSVAALGGNSTYARFRLSTDADAQHPTGSANDGEVEDYFGVTIAAAQSPDYGDAPDDGNGATNGPGDYNTLAATGGPSHAVINNLYLGSSVDGEADGQPNANVLGDDNDGHDDENGIVDTSQLVWVHGQSPVVNVNVTNQSGISATLAGWIDYNANGLFEIGERALATVPNGSTNADVALTFPAVPAGFVGSTAARFRFSTNGAAAQLPTGAAPDGEVEDYSAYLSDVPVFDFGDAPDTSVGVGTGNYNTTIADDGPRHALQAPTPLVYLGDEVDAELDSTQPSSATSDDTTGSPDDEDGIASPDTELALLFGETPQVRIDAVNNTVSTAFLYGWIDYDGDGVFETSEQTSAVVPAGTNGTISLTFPAVPLGAAANTYARFRISTLEVAVKNRPVGGAPDGEVEDYAVTITTVVPDHIGVYRGSDTFFFQDFNDDGSPDASHPLGALGDVPLTGDWDGDGDDEHGVYRPATGAFFLDVNGNGIWDGTPTDTMITFGALGDTPIIGDWNNDGVDQIGVFRPSTVTFYRDVNGNGMWDGTPTDSAIAFGALGDSPIVGDWNGDGEDEIGVFRDTSATFLIDANGNGVWDDVPTDQILMFGAPGDLPVIGDWDGDQDDDIAVFRPSALTFYRDLNGNGAWDGFSIDDAVALGTGGDVPTAGKWAVPLMAASAPTDDSFGAAAIETADLQPILAAAVDRWEASGLSATQLATLRQVDVRVADLGGSLLAVAGHGTIVIDANAAGHGWFIDATPQDNDEFSTVGSDGLIAAGDSAAAGHMDLLTVLLHELGHILGEADEFAPGDSDDVMFGRLDTGVRRLPA